MSAKPTDWQLLGTKVSIAVAAAGLFAGAVAGWIRNDHRLTVVEQAATTNTRDIGNNMTAIKGNTGDIRELGRQMETHYATVNGKLNVIIQQTKRGR